MNHPVALLDFQISPSYTQLKPLWQKKLTFPKTPHNALGYFSLYIMKIQIKVAPI